MIRRDIIRTRRFGFTLIEMLVVVGVIGLLAAIGFGVAGAVRSGAYNRNAEMLLKNLDVILDEYMGEMGRMPTIPDDNGDGKLTDADVERFYHFPTPASTEGTYIYSVSAFLDKVGGVGAVDSMVAGIAPRNLTTRGQIEAYAGFAYDSGPDKQEEKLTIVDLDGNEIYFVHPHLSTRYLQSGESSDHNLKPVFGQTSGGRPYFMAIGKDGEPGDASDDDEKGFLDDNVYSVTPELES
jgi:prepilin-type N-terminal cleavage/methylation domain-containing protein